MIEMREETFGAIHGEILPLWVSHYAEIAEDKDRVPFDPDWERYAVLALRGNLSIVTARREGVLIGYVFAIVDTHLHYRSTLFALFDLYYLEPEHRGGRTAARLFAAAEAMLRRRGVTKAIGNTKLAHDQGRLFEALGWREAERTYVKVLEAA